MTMSGARAATLRVWVSGVGEAGAVMVVGLGDEHLGLVHQPAKSSAVDDAVAVALVKGPVGMSRLGVAPPPAPARLHGVGSENLVFPVQPVGRLKRNEVVGHERFLDPKLASTLAKGCGKTSWRTQPVGRS